MATVAYTIYSHYDFPVKEIADQNEKNPLEAARDAWQAEISTIKRSIAPAPQFVPATTPYKEWDSAQTSSSPIIKGDKDPLGNDLATWYRSLTSSDHSNSTQRNGDASTSQRACTSHRHTQLPRKEWEKRNKNNWFIMNAIQSEPAPLTATPSSLASILIRDPPPLPSQQRYKPPVWLAIGPSNKGFEMLQRSGWNEGEALGADVARRKVLDSDFSSEDPMILLKRKGKGRETGYKVKREIMEVKLENEDLEEVSELRKVDVIDLTLSDSEVDLDVVSEFTPKSSASSAPTNPISAGEFGSGYERKALLTPIATVLKSDRLGIGLKAKTVGPYKASQKRVTHNAAALAAHIKAAEESRIRKKVLGRGRRGYTRQQKADERNRKDLLAYLNN